MNFNHITANILLAATSSEAGVFPAGCKLNTAVVNLDFNVLSEALSRPLILITHWRGARKCGPSKNLFPTVKILALLIIQIVEESKGRVH